MVDMNVSKKNTSKKHEQAFAKYLIYATYLFIAFAVTTVIQLLLGLIPKFTDTGAWSMFITIRLLFIMLSIVCVLIFFVYLILYALKEEE